MSFLNEVFSEWAVLAAKAENGGKVKKKEIIRLLDSDAPIPESAKPLLKGLITGSLEYQRGTGSEYEELKGSAVLRYHAVLGALTAPTVESVLKEQARLLGDPTPVMLAKEIVSGQLGVSTRALEKWLKEAGEQ